MIVKIKDGSQQQIFVGSMITLDPAVITPNGPFAVTAINQGPNQDQFSMAEVPNPVGADIVLDVDNSSIPQQLIDFGNGVQALMFADAAKLVSDLQSSEAALAQQVKDLESGAAIAPLNQQIQTLSAQVQALQTQLQNAVAVWPVGVGATLAKVESILTQPIK